MRVSIVLEQRFVHLPDGRAYDNGQATYLHWQRYLGQFEEVQVVGRSQPVTEVPPGYRPVDGPGVRFWPVPYYQGPLGLARRLEPVLSSLQRALEAQDTVVVRLSGVLGHLAAELRLAQGRPFSAEIINDPYQGFASGGHQTGVGRVTQPLFRTALTRLTQRHTRRAAATQYVTREALQRRYPPAGPVSVCRTCICRQGPSCPGRVRIPGRHAGRSWSAR